MDTEEMTAILEELIRDPDVNATARCTAIRTLRELQGPNPPKSPKEFSRLYEIPGGRHTGNGAA
jgi:hypothetical protein